ncbi:MAG: hypothetical protein LCH61_00955 [Proteobacteria bacterium]|nr:hypothetical protein [Pseudomonadota bacterium]
MTARFIASDYLRGRILLRSGTVDVGAVFPPAGLPRDRLPWTWRLWLNGKTCATDGRAKTELAAKNALLAAWRDFIARVGLMERTAND